VRSAGRAGRSEASGVRPARRRAARVLVPAGLAVLAVAGCAGPGPDDARDVVSALGDAVVAGDGAAACALLLPDAADALAEETGEPCAQAVTAPDGPLADLVATGRVVVEDVHVAGHQAQVVTADDTLFLAVSGDGWVVTAAGCTPREDRPYDCEVEA